jgi:hypothetical protein
MKFTDIIEELGLDTTLPVFVIKDYKISRMYETASGNVKIETFISPYYNKVNYLYAEWSDHKDHPDIFNRIKNLSEYIIATEEANIAEVGWTAIYSVDPRNIESEARRKILMKFMVDTRKDIAFGWKEDFLKPQHKTVLCGFPVGVKIDFGFTDESRDMGKIDRVSFSKRFGLGDLKPDGFVYGRYDENLKLQPI